MTESTHTTRVAPLPCDALAAERTLVMGILNVTPDSFSDGGQHYAATDAIAHAARMIAEGASIIDIGGESTRPGAVRISVEEDFGAGVNGVLKNASNGSAIRSLKKFLRVGISMVIIVIS